MVITNIYSQKRNYFPLCSAKKGKASNWCFFIAQKEIISCNSFCTIIGAYYRLWDYEVVEIFFLSSKDNMYLEVEFGPHGHHLGLLLKSRQKCIKHSFPIDYTAKIGRHTVFLQLWIPPKRATSNFALQACLFIGN